MDASVCTAFASQHFNSSGIIEVRLNSIRTADVLINGEVLDFDESNSYQFPGKIQNPVRGILNYALGWSCYIFRNCCT